MDINICEDCLSATASHYCLCRTPLKTFLCSLCLSTHIQRPGSHTILSAAVELMLDSRLQDERIRVVIDLLYHIDEITALAEQEQSMVEQMVKDVYLEQCRKLWRNFDAAQTAIVQAYQEVQRTLGRIKGEVKQLETKARVSLSEEAWRFLKFRFHAENTVLHVMDINKEVGKFVTGESVVSSAGIVAGWSCDVRGCATCSKAAARLNLPPPPVRSRTEAQNTSIPTEQSASIQAESSAVADPSTHLSTIADLRRELEEQSSLLANYEQQLEVYKVHIAEMSKSSPVPAGEVIAVVRSLLECLPVQ